MKIVLSDPKGKRAYNIEIEESNKAILIGRKVGEAVSGKDLGLSGYEIRITGGCDKDGTPIKKGVAGAGRTRVLIGKGQGYRQKEKGVIKRKLVRGDTVSDDIVQVNAVVSKRGKKPLEKLLSNQ